MPDPKLVPVRAEPENQTAIVFLHGFLGATDKTWGRFPGFVAADPRLSGWDVHCVGYETSLFSYLPFWSSDPDIDLLADQLVTVLRHPPFDRYAQVALVGHSMGGLVAQRALVDSDDIQDKVGFLLMYGTPSGGLESAGRFGLFKRQIASMARGGPFIEGLRARWNEKFREPTKRPFTLRVVGGDRDAFVPRESWMDPFDPADCEVSRGDHTEIVKPETAEHLSVQIAIKTLMGDAAPGDPWGSARVALEMGHFRDVVEALEPNVAELDSAALVDLAIALEHLERGDDARGYLERYAEGTDARGTLAGRLKRAWIHERRKLDGQRALEIYRENFERARAAGDHPQAAYLGINVAYMQLAFEGAADAAKETARVVLAHCDKCPTRFWNLATVAEAQLYLGEPQRAVETYARALELAPEPWKIQSAYQQAMSAAEHLEIPVEPIQSCFLEGWRAKNES